jgi:hypothetical protein
MEQEIYVVVAENDQPHRMPNKEEPFFDDGGPLVFEQYTRTADLESIKKRAIQMEAKYGKCRIAKLEFIDVYEYNHLPQGGHEMSDNNTDKLPQPVGSTKSTAPCGQRGFTGYAINCDQVALILNVFDRYLPKSHHPSVSRERDMKKYGMLYEVMEAAGLKFEDESARWNGTPNDALPYEEEGTTQEPQPLGVNVERLVSGTHERFDRMVWAFRKDFTGALAKWLVKQSPYHVPDKLESIIADFHERIPYDFDQNNGMAKVSLATMTENINNVLETMPDVIALNERKTGREGFGFSSRHSKNPEPDDDFIDIMALAQNITCEFAEREDAQCWLNR